MSLLGTYTQLLTKKVSQAYIAGPDLTDAIHTCHRFSQRGISSTIGYWDKVEEDPQFVADAYLTALDTLKREDLNCYLSIKAPSLQLSPDLIMEIVKRGRDASVGIHFDSLAPETASQTIALVASAVQHFPQIGCTLPGRWKRSLQDVNQVIDLGVKVRVVKGQWADPNYPNIDLREGFLAVINQLAGCTNHVAVATHDPALAREALRRLKEAGTPCELELLFGLPSNAVMRVADEMGVKVRLYVPYGEAYAPYALSQVRKKPQILWWIIRDTLISFPRTIKVGV